MAEEGSPLSPDDDLERVVLSCLGEGVVGGHHVVQREVVRAISSGDLPRLDQRCSSSGTVVPSTSPVVMVTSLIHSSSRCSVVGAPCTPMLAMTPPGRTTLVQMSKVPGVPTASIATSAPSPAPVSAATRSSAAGSAALIVASAPKQAMLEPGFGEIQRDDAGGAGQRRGLDRGQPTGPTPTTTTTSPGLTRPFLNHTS